METVKTIIEKLPEALGAVTLVLSGLTALFLLIPGEQPEKAFQKISEILSKFSRK